MNGQEFSLFDFDLKSNIDIMGNFSSFCVSTWMNTVVPYKEYLLG